MCLLSSISEKLILVVSDILLFMQFWFLSQLWFLNYNWIVTVDIYRLFSNLVKIPMRFQAMNCLFRKK